MYIMIICHWAILHYNMSFKTIAGRSDGVFLFCDDFLHFLEIKKKLLNSPKYLLVTSTIFFLIFRKCRKSSENTIRPSCNCLEWHIVMAICPKANCHYVHNLWQSLRRDSEHFRFWLFPEYGSISERTVNRASIVHTI